MKREDILALVLAELQVKGASVFETSNSDFWNGLAQDKWVLFIKQVHTELMGFPPDINQNLANYIRAQALISNSKMIENEILVRDTLNLAITHIKNNHIKPYEQRTGLWASIKAAFKKFFSYFFPFMGSKNEVVDKQPPPPYADPIPSAPDEKPAAPEALSQVFPDAEHAKAPPPPSPKKK